MWIEELNNGKFKYVDRYTDPMTDKYKKVSVTLNSNSRVAWNKAQRELNNKIDNKLKKVNRSDSTFGEMLTQWHEVYKHTVKGSTYIRSKHTMRIVKRYIPDDYLIRSIDTAFVQETLESIYYEEDYSYSSTKHCKAMISSVMEFAKKRNAIEINPVLEVELKKKPATIAQIEKIENKYLEPDELDKVISMQRSRSHGKRNSDLTEFLSLTGLRYGEAVALKEHNFKDGYIEVYGTLDYHARKVTEGVVTATKTAKGTRKVDLSERAIEILNEVILENHLMRNEEKFVDKKFIFVSIYGNPLSISTFNESLRNVEQKLGLNKRVSSHILRHTHISVLAELGVPLKAIMDRVGHTKPETTLKIYTHVTEKTKSNLIDSLNSYRK